MKRRTLLTGVCLGAVGTAGCLSWSQRSPFCAESYTLSLSRVRHDQTTIPEATRTTSDLNPSPLIHDLITDVLDGNTITLETEEYPRPFNHTSHQQTVHVKHDGTYYEITRETRETESISGPEYIVSRSGGEPSSATDENTLAFSKLPLHDQWRLHDALESHITDTGGVRIFSDTFVAGYLDTDFQEDSHLASGIDYQYLVLTDFNERYVEVEQRDESTAPARRFQYTADPVADDSESFTDYFLDEYAIDVTELQTETQDLLEDLLDNREKEICTDVTGDPDEVEIEMADEAEQTALDELESLTTGTVFSNMGSRLVYLRHEDTEYELQFSVGYREK